MRSLLQLKIALQLLLIGFITESSALDPQSLMLKAKIYFEAEEYSQAEELYNKLLNEALTPREKAIIQYDIGSINLANEDWDNAINWLDQAASIAEKDPLLNYRIKKNRSLALYGKALSASDTENEIFLLRDALKRNKQAMQAYCELSKIEGYKECKTHKDLEEVNQQINTRLKERGAASEIPPMEQLINMQLNSVKIFQEFLSKEENPASFLDWLINLQELAINLNLISQELDSKNPEVQTLLQSAQEYVQSQADLFISEVVALQKREFPMRCQEHPWKEVLTFFNEGYAASYEAVNRMKMNKDALLFQEQALSAWKRAREALKQYASKPEEAVEGYDQEKHVENILQRLQEMEKDDKSKPIEYMEKKDVPKPW